MNKRIVFMAVSLVLMFFLTAEAFGQARLTINCNVRGADVTFDGTRIGKTPLRTQVAVGRHTIGVSYFGYQSEQRVVIIQGDLRLDFELKKGGNVQPPPPERSEFDLRINCDVRGAKIFINNRLMGQTPEVVQLRAGSYNLKITADGYVDFITNIKVSDDTTINADLQRAQRFFSLSISANVRGAMVYVDDRRAGNAPVRTKLQEGQHNIKVTAPGFEDYTETINLNGNQRINARLERARRFYTLSILSDVPDARVWINNEAQNGGTPLTVKLEEGTYKIKVQARRARPYETTIRLTRDTTIKADLVPDNAKIKVVIPNEIIRFDRAFRGTRIVVLLDGRRQKGLEFEVSRGRHTVRVQAGSWYVDQQLNCREGNTYILRPVFTMEVSEEDSGD